MQVKRRWKERNKNKCVIILVIMLFLSIIFLFWVFKNNLFPKSESKMVQISNSTVPSSLSSDTSNNSGDAQSVLQTDSKSDWQLVLVNLNNKKSEMNPKLVNIGNIQMDARIQKNVEDFFTAAKAVDPKVHLISGYRSVEYQSHLFSSYVQQTMTENPSWTEAQATSEVMTYSQPSESSEHETGLAMDMSTVDSLNQEDPNVASQIAAIAPRYGFILRFPTWGQKSTGIEYEDWHFRYVGEANAKYITDNHLTLEQFLDKLSK